MTSGAGLFVVASPIGNLSDITLRAIETLKDADLVVAEDTRRSRALLSHLGIAGKPVRCIDAHSGPRDIEFVVSEVAEGRCVALLTDAGTPVVSDPGHSLVAACRARSLNVVPIPGPSAVTTAIAGCGLVESGFWFAGFLPRKGSKRKALLERIAAFPDAVVLFESPHRTFETLRDLSELCPNRLACVARELTKKFEEFVTLPLAQWAESEREFRGEVTLVLGPLSQHEQEDDHSTPEQREALARTLVAEHPSAKDAAQQLVDVLGMGKREAYQLVLKLRQEALEPPMQK
jgi:16S rRNA (cytidine1402-2'-O)-methyltransferase